MKQEVNKEAQTWLEDVQEKLQQPQYSQDYVPYHSIQAKWTISKQGQQSIFIRKATDDSKRASAAFSITASGLLLQPCLVFKDV